MNHDYEFTEIDPHNLHEELAKQPGMYGFWSKKKTRANKVLMEASEILKTIRSELIRDCYDDPQGTLNSVKATAQQVEAYYRTDKGYKEAKKEWIEAQTEFDEMDQKLFQIHQRKSSLEGLVRLYGMEYFSEVNVPKHFNKSEKDYETEKKERRERNNEKVRSRKRRSRD